MSHQSLSVPLVNARDDNAVLLRREQTVGDRASDQARRTICIDQTNGSLIRLDRGVSSAKRFHGVIIFNVSK
jgi:hypothetical protein